MPPSNEDIEAVIQMAMASSRPSDAIPGRDTRTQLFVGNLPYRVRWQDLKDLFRKAGTVLRSDVSLSPDNRSRGYGTVLLATLEDANRAIELLHGYSWQGRTLEVRLDRLPGEADAALGLGLGIGATGSSKLSSPMSIPKYLPHPEEDGQSSTHSKSELSSDSNGKNLFVGNLPFHCQWQDLKDLFRRAGTILRADVALGADGRSRGFGTVIFATEVDSERAVSMFNGYEYNGRVLKVHFDKFSHHSVAAASAASSIQTSSYQSHPQYIALPVYPYVATGPDMVQPQIDQNLALEAHSSESSMSPTSHPTSQNARRPGKIALPPQNPGMYNYPMASPVFAQPSHPSYMLMTPHGLPPMTPSMPPFTFLPSPHHHPASGHGTPSLYPSASSSHMHHHSTHSHSMDQQSNSRLMGALSPGAFFGRPGAPGTQGNPFMNVAPGAPVHHVLGSPGIVFGMSTHAVGGSYTEPSGYFDVPGYTAPPYVSSSAFNQDLPAESPNHPPVLVEPRSDSYEPKSHAESHNLFYEDDESPSVEEGLHAPTTNTTPAKSASCGDRDDGAPSLKRFGSDPVKEAAAQLHSLNLSC